MKERERVDYIMLGVFIISQIFNGFLQFNNYLGLSIFTSLWIGIGFLITLGISGSYFIWKVFGLRCM
jgi:hypothetical protein